ncbi:MAG: DinB family protein [Ignavibacteria bacterium]|nr:DinB family protein [Ignavibacteria bacterium]
MNSLKSFLGEQKEYLLESYAKLLLISDGEASSKQDGKWSKKEILGHLIDSASNNHQRFVRAQFKEDLVFLGYDQDEWVRVQNYQYVNWYSLVELWKGFNFLIAHLAAEIPDEILLAERKKHNLFDIASVAIPENKPATLDYFIRDYYVHLKHHMEQIVESVK